MKRVLVVVSALLLALAIVSCGNLAVDKKDDGGSLVINLGGSEVRSTQATIKDVDGNSIGNVTLRTSDDVTDWELFLYTSTGTDVSYTVKEPASSVIQFDDLPEGEFAVGIVAYDGDTPFGFAQSNYNAETGTIDTVTIKAGTVATTEVDFVYMKSISCTGSDKSFMNVHYSTIRPSTNIPGSINVPGFKDHSPVGKEFDYWTVDGDTSGTHYNPNAEVDLNGKTLPIVFVPVWKDATNPPGGDPDPTNNFTPVALGLNMITVIGKPVTSSIGHNDDYGSNISPFYNASSANSISVNSFMIADTELTYEKWYEVYQWATSDERGTNKYTIGNLGRPGSSGEDGVDVATLDENTKNQPVTQIEWRDAVVWCNAASEREGLKPVYYLEGTTDLSDKSKVIRYSEDFEYEGTFMMPSGTLYTKKGISIEKALLDQGRADKAVIDESANGYRLPYETEWEFAARGGNPSDEEGAVWKYQWAGTDTESQLKNFAVYNASATSPVKTKSPNTLEIYDMIGNAGEWCWNKYGYGEQGDWRVIRGSSYEQNMTIYLTCDYRGKSYQGYNGLYDTGFRVARNAN